MYLLATKCTVKNESDKIREREFFETQTTTPALVYSMLRTVIDFGQSRLSGLSLGAFINSTRKNRIAYQPFVWA